MTIALVIMEGLLLSFWLLLICVVGIANGPVGLVTFYEKDVQDRVIELGLTTKEKIKKTRSRRHSRCIFPSLSLCLRRFICLTVRMGSGKALFR